MKYWDNINGVVVDNNLDGSYAPIYDGFENYIETYELDGGERIIDISYSQRIKDSGDLSFWRRSILKRHCIKPSDIKKLIRYAVPSSEYKRIMGF